MKTEKISAVFTNNIPNSRIKSLVLFGTFAFDIQSAGSDLDLYLILDSQREDDYLFIQQIIADLNYPNLDFTVDYLDQLELKGWINFQFKHHGIYFAYTLANASQILIGKNILLDYLSTIDYGEYMNSIRFQCEVYFKRIQEKLYFKSLDFDWYIKYFKRICIMILTLNNELNTSRVTLVTIDEILIIISKSSIFTSFTKELLTNLNKINYLSDVDLLLRTIQKDINQYFYIEQIL